MRTLIFSLLLFLSACSTVKVEDSNSYPVPPKAGPKVAKELRVICSNEKNCTNLIEFFQRYEKHYDVLMLRIKNQKDNK